MIDTGDPTVRLVIRGSLFDKLSQSLGRPSAAGCADEGEDMTSLEGSDQGFAWAKNLDGDGRLIVCPEALARSLRCVIAALAEQPDLDGLLDAVVAHGHALAISSIGVWTVKEDHLLLVGSAGYPGRSIDRFTRLPLTANVPCSDAASRSAPVVCGDRHALFTSYPLLERIVQRTYGVIAYPVVRSGHVLGTMSFHLTMPVAVDEHALAHFAALADLTATIFPTEAHPLDNVVQFSLVRTEVDPGTDDLRTTHEAFDGDLSPEPATVEERLASLERQMHTVRQMMMFFGAIANDRFDDFS